MSNFQAYNDKVRTLPVSAVNTAGVAQAFPTGSLAAVSSNPASLGVTVQQSPPAITLTPKVQNSPGISVTVTGTALTPAVLMVDVVPDPNQLSVLIDVASADGATVAQAVPVATGP